MAVAAAPEATRKRRSITAPGVEELAGRLSDVFETKVKIQIGRSKGRVVVEFGSVDDLHEAARRLDELGVEHGEVTPLPAFGLVILSLQDPDDVNLELAAPTPTAGRSVRA